MKFILGRKIGMTRIFDEEGRTFAVTRIAALPCEISQVKDGGKDGYKSVQVTAFKDDEKKKAVKIAEFKETNSKKFKKGDEVKASQFKIGESVTVEGKGKGKGFAGTVKRHSFARGPETHGSKNVRRPGSIGGGYPERVVLGRKMPGHMGGVNVTVKNLRVMDVDDEILLIAGAVPGPRYSIIKVFGSGEKAEEIVDHAAEEERIAQEKMLEADKAEKAEKTDGEKSEEVTSEKTEEKAPDEEVKEDTK